MGADGGVCWVKVSDQERFEDLVEPFGVLYFDDRESNWEWWKENQEDGYHYNTYSTGFDPDLHTLLRALREVEDIRLGLDISWNHRDWEDNTIEEAILSIVTRPYGSALSCHLDDVLKNVYIGGTIYLTDRFKTMLLVDWASQISEVIDPNSYGYIETWT